MIPRLLLYWRTLRHLKPVQIYARLWFGLVRPRPDVREAPARRRQLAPFAEPCRRPRSLHDSTRFEFLGETRTLSAAADWNEPSADKLWLYNLHYFDDLNAAGAQQRTAWHRALITRWIAENPPGEGVGWEPYPASLRIVNWVKWALQGQLLEDPWLHSLGVQARWLRRRLEWHLLGNHLLANAKALVFAGVFFEGPEADEWRECGLRILEWEVPEQILPDGGHFERSPMYHAIVLEDVLDLLNLVGAFPGVIGEPVLQRWRETVQRMRRWLQVMSHPDGEIGFFNDAACGIAASPAQVESYAARLELPDVAGPSAAVTHLASSGYVRVQQGALVALLDVAPVGPDHLPAHAHADTLSFELSLGGGRVIVNSGTSCYGAGPERLRQRGTAAHSTVALDGADSSEVWAGFRVARRAQPFGLSIDESGGQILVSCAHDGYCRLPGRPVHRRRWEFRAGQLSVTDSVEGAFGEAVARFHLHPDVDVEFDGSRHVLHRAGFQLAACEVQGGRLRTAPGSYHPGFGRSIGNQRLEAEFSGTTLTTTLSFAPTTN